MYAEVVLLFDGFNDQALTVDFEVTAIPDLTTHFRVEGGFIKHQLVIGLTFLSQFSVFENLYVAGGVIVANEVGGSILEYYPVAGFEQTLSQYHRPKLALTGALAQGVARKAGSPVRVTMTTDARQELDGAAFGVTTIRVGGDEGRVLDEHIALRHGVLGQETTGPGGFAMALRSIPAILGYALSLIHISEPTRPY